MSEDKELLKLLKKTDQSITAHSILRDSHSTRSTMLDVSLLLLSAAITFMSFASDHILDSVMPDFIQNELVLPVLALLLFAVAIVELRVGWKVKSSAHGEAANALARFKHELSRAIGNNKSNKDIDVEALATNYQYVNSSIVKIPDGSFLRLKKAHKKKVEISKLLDTYPGASVVLLEIKLFFRDNFGAKFFVKDGAPDGTNSSSRN